MRASLPHITSCTTLCAWTRAYLCLTNWCRLTARVPQTIGPGTAAVLEVNDALLVLRGSRLHALVGGLDAHGLLPQRPLWRVEAIESAALQCSTRAWTRASNDGIRFDSGKAHPARLSSARGGLARVC